MNQLFSSIFQSNKTITTVEESSHEAEKRNETVNITNLTAEIESFVRTADTDEESIVEHRKQSTNDSKKTNSNIKYENVEISNKNTRQSPESNDYYPHDEQQCDDVTIEKIQNLGAMDNDLSNNSERCKRSPVKILIRAPTEEEQTLATINEDSSKAVVEPESDYETKDTEQETIIVESQQIEKKNEEKKVVDPVPNVIENEKIESVKSVDEEDEIRTKANFTPTSTEVEFILENNKDDQPQPEENLAMNLRITESTDDLTKIKEETPQTVTKYEVVNEPLKPASPILTKKINSTKENEPDQSKVTTNGAERCVVVEKNVATTFRVSTIPLKTDSPVAIRKATNLATTEKKREPPTPPQRRRSVKDIIESINKCQSLLKVNQDQRKNKLETDKTNANLLQSTSSSTITQSNKNSIVDRNMNDLTVKPFNNKKMFSEISEINNNAKHDDELSNIPLFVERFSEFNNNNPNLFEKCTVRRESKMNDVDQKGKISNMEWNPVPKPRRHRNSAQGSIN